MLDLSLSLSLFSRPQVESRNKTVGLIDSAYITFQRDLAKFFFSCSDTVAWMFLSPLAPVILKARQKVETFETVAF